MKGYADDAVCPSCKTYTQQYVVKRGVRKCLCGKVFNLKETETLRTARKKRTPKEPK